MTTPKLEDVLKFPCEFQIKIMGENVPELIQEVTKVILEHDVLFNPELQTLIRNAMLLA